VQRSLALSILIIVALCALPVCAQQPTRTLTEQLIGTWDLVETYSERSDGTRFGAFGPNPSGRYMLDAQGRFSYMIYGSGRPKFASNNRLEGTPDEYKSAVQGVIAFYGTYTVDERTRTVTWHVERCSFPNWEGSDRKSTVVTLDADNLSYTADPIPSAAGPYVPHVSWKRAH
jgi:Lipocalin-like domain